LADQRTLQAVFSVKAILRPIVGGYTGRGGGKTILPHRAVTKVDMRLVLDMKAADALAALKAHLAKRGSAISK